MFVDVLVREVNAQRGEKKVLTKVDGIRYDLNQLSFADNRVLMIHLEEKLEMLMSMFRLVC